MSDKGHSDGESDIDDHSSSDSESNIDDDGSSDGETDIDDDETKRIMDEIDDELGYSIDVYKRARLYIPLNQTPRTWLPNFGHKFSRHNDDLYSWAPPKELNIERLLRSYQLSIEELITVGETGIAYSKMTLTNDSSCRSILHGLPSGTVAPRVNGDRLMSQSSWCVSIRLKYDSTC
jgi:hypothetical protein